MKFGPLHKAYFNADEGAYSKVTSRERTDYQITVSEADGEAAVVLTAIGASNIPREAADGKRQQVTVVQRTGTETPTTITINYPKATGDELRIYRSAKDGFDFEADDIWYVFRRGKKLFVGCMHESKWRSIGTCDQQDDAFQDGVDSTDPSAPPGYVEFAGKKIPRDPRIARQAIQKAGYVCEYSYQPTPFISKRTGKSYVEAHHLIPLGLQPGFTFPLDSMDNIVALSPIWHRAIHHAEPATVRNILKALTTKRKSYLNSHGIDEASLIQLYGCEYIV